MLHIDDLERLQFIASLVESPADRKSPAPDTRAGRLLAMLHSALWGAGDRLDRVTELLRRLNDQPG